MKREKSCGAIVYRHKNGRVELLLLKHRFGGHWSFPKGHVEAGETEEQTALREVKEETGLSVTLHPGPRQAVEYYPKQGVKKQVVYFIGRACADAQTHRQESEVSEISWLPLEDALGAVTFKNDRRLICWAKACLSAAGQEQS